MNPGHRIGRFLQRKGDRLNALRRRTDMLLDQGIALTQRKLSPHTESAPFDGEARFALVTVNFSTTHYLKLMLLTLAEQHDMKRISRIVLVDNDSRDGGQAFCQQLADSCPKVHLVENRWRVNHGRGLRSGVSALERVEQVLPVKDRSNVLLVCDTDIIFRNPDTLGNIAHLFEKEGSVFAGELRHGLYPYPEAQASFFALRRNIYDRKNVRPFVHHGAPAYWTQRSLWQAGFTLTNFPSNKGGYILHRGRSGVSAAREYRPRDAHATARDHRPHYMGIAGGEGIWQATESRHDHWLLFKNEQQLVEVLSQKLAIGA